MARSSTWIIKTGRLALDLEVASVIVRMMMAVNDSALANAALAEWSKTTDVRRAPRAPGARMYFSRIQMGHALEALEIVKEIQESVSLRKAVADCDSRTRQSFAELESFLLSSDYTTLVQIRNNLSFHYGSKLVRGAVERISSAHPDDESTFSLGTDVLDWHFALADKVTDTIMVRDLLRVPTTQPAQPATDQVIGRLWKMQVTFADFAAYFSRRHAK